MTRRAGATLGIIGLALCAAWTGMAADAESSVADLVGRMPAQSGAELDAACAELIALGAPAVRQVCDMLAAPGTGDDTNPRYLISGLAKYATQDDRDDERELLAGVLLDALDAAMDDEVKAFLVRQLQVAGGDESVTPLASLLSDEAFCDPATQALTAIGTRDATAALVAAYPGAVGACRAVLIKALGTLECDAELARIEQDTASEDAEVRDAARFALASIGAPSSQEYLAAAAEVEEPYARAKATSLYLLYARRLAENGDKRQAAGICRALLDARTEPGDVNVRCAALAGLVDADGRGALDDLVAAMDSPDKQFRGGALELAARIPGRGATRRWVKKLADASPEARQEIVAMLGDRGDRAALGALVDALGDEDQAVRLAAVNAVTRLGGSKAVPALLAYAGSTDDADELAAVKAALLRVPGEGAVTAVSKALDDTPAAGRVVLLEVLSARRAEAQVESVFAQTADADKAVRVAAIKAMGNVARASDVPRLVGLVLAAQSDAERAEAQKVAVSTAGQIAAVEERAGAALEALGNSDGAQRAALLEMLPGLGGAKALAVVIADTKSADKAVQDAAIRALADWPDAHAAPELLAIAKATEELTHHVLALRGYVRLAGVAKLEPQPTLWMYQHAMAAAKRVDEKKLALSGMANVRTAESLQVVAGYLGDAELKEEAASAAVRIACPQNDKDKGLTDPETLAALKRVVIATDSADVRAQAEAQIASVPVPEERNLAHGKAVKASVAQQGDHRPELAVDGNTSNDSAWYGASWPAWFMVDLGRAAALDSVHVFFYSDGERSYAYTVEVSADAEHWQPVADMAGNTAAAAPQGVLHLFAPVTARYVRVNIVKNSANEAVHLNEVKVYGPGEVQAAPVAAAPVAAAPAAATGPDGFVSLFNGKDLAGWEGDTSGYVAENGMIVCKPGGNLYTAKDYADFVLQFEFQLTPGANNGLGIRMPPNSHAAYEGMELQILDDTAEKYKDLQPYQYHGSIYGVVPAERGHLKPVGEWNSQEVIAKGRRITVKLNGVTIVDADIDKASTPATMDGKAHPGLKRTTGRIGFLGHGSVVSFRNIRIKELD
ncbi:MAG: DUF1080 domain-containing protein [Candidatus Hydrogenedentes bacterium]|nr:DUF1080 domain-containing protein [Candidatus Hydrogenedentota bacterium]